LISEEGLVWYGDNRAGQVQRNAYPNYKENIVLEQVGQVPYWGQQAQQGKVFRALSRLFNERQ